MLTACQNESWQFQRPWQAHQFQKRLVQKLLLSDALTVSQHSVYLESGLMVKGNTLNLKSAQLLSLSLQIWDCLVKSETSCSPRAPYWGHLVLYFVIVFLVWLWTNWTCVIHMQSSPSVGRTGGGLQEHSKTVPATSAWRHGPC